MGSANEKRRYNVTSSHWLSPYPEWSWGFFARTHHISSAVAWFLIMGIVYYYTGLHQSLTIDLQHWLEDYCHKILQSQGCWPFCTVPCRYNTVNFPWWHHQVETFSTLLALCVGNFPVAGEFSAQRPVTQSFDVFFDLCLNKWLSKQSWGWWFETPSCSLWCPISSHSSPVRARYGMFVVSFKSDSGCAAVIVLLL